MCPILQAAASVTKTSQKGHVISNNQVSRLTRVEKGSQKHSYNCNIQGYS